MSHKSLLPVIFIGLILVGCADRNKNQFHAQSGRPVIYDAWDARYDYEMENRKLAPFHQGRQVGRTWSRDSSGKINHASYFTPSNEKNTEDLFVLHSMKLDRQREKKWDQSKEQRINFIKNQMEILKEEENAPLVEVLIEEEEEEFVPPAFIPQGIDINTVSEPMENESSDETPPAFPFAPLP